jgi:DNA (cytosine-5)-methyltransferase 1
MTVVRAFDMFCGAGGSSTGMAQACEEFGVGLQLSAVNHWKVAIATHERNHPGARHRCANAEHAPLDELAPDGVDVLWASPECTEHSYAKGGSSIDDQRRVSAWAVPRAVEAWRPKIVIVENVRPFLKWGPTELVIDPATKRPMMDKKGREIRRPIKARQGETFRAWFSAIESMGYVGKWELLNAADYGEPQTRVRLFVVFTAHGYTFDYPLPTHGKGGTLEVERGIRKKWEPARKIIDFALESESIFTRKDPLSPNTMRRIEAGIRRYCKGPLAEAFLVVLRQYADARSLDDPVPTIAAAGTHLALAEPELRPFTLGQHTNAAARDVDEPISTVTTHGYTRLFEPTAIVLGQHGGGTARSVDEPLSTISTDGYVRVFEPMVVDVRHGDRPHQPKSVDEPLGTVTGKNGAGIVEPMILPQHGESPVRSVDDPLPTVVASRPHPALVEPFIASYYGDKGGEGRTRDIDEPLPTVPTENRFAVVEPFIVPQANGAAPASTDDPLATVTTTSRGIRLVQAEVIAAEAGVSLERVVIIDGLPYVLDIKFRMLQPLELARAQGFPDEYEFTGTKEARTMQIGNAVPVAIAKHLMRSALRAIYGDVDEVAA